MRGVRAASSSSSSSLGDPRVAFSDRSSLSLLRSLAVFRLCTVRPLVARARPLLALSTRLLGRGLTDALLRHTVFNQFVAGEDEDGIRPTIAGLRRAGVGAILDYAAESDVAPAAPAAATALAEATAPAEATPTKLATRRPRHTYFSPVALEAEAEPHRTAMESNLVHSVHGVQLAGRALSSGGKGFAAVKLTALARPELLQHVSTLLRAHTRAFHRLAAAGAPAAGGAVTREAFVRHVRRSTGVSEVTAARIFLALDYVGDGVLDQLEFADAASLLSFAPQGVGRELEAAAGLGDSPGSLARLLGLAGPPDDADDMPPHLRAEYAALSARAHALASAASDAGISIMIDAEQTYLQPAIDAVTASIQRRFNRPAIAASAWVEPSLAHAQAIVTTGEPQRWPYLDPAHAAPMAAPFSVGAAALPRGGALLRCYPVVVGTLQAYLRDAPERLALTLMRARRERFVIGLKLVRGAYMVQERARAVELDYDDPVWPSQDQTHACYDACADSLLQEALAGRAELMLATHNEASVLRVLARMEELRPSWAGAAWAADCGISFGQLLGMCDFMSFALGARGCSVFKYVPYGAVRDVIPYLLRRAEENSDMLGGVGKEIALLEVELMRRAGLR